MIEEIIKRGYHNHRLQEHSDIVGEGIYSDLVKSCDCLKEDVDKGIVKHWLNVRTPGARNRKIDLLIGEPDADGKPILDLVRVCVENKSVITAHRNKDARFDDLNETLQVLQRVKPEAVTVATILIGTAERSLNVPDRIKPSYSQDEFTNNILPRLSKSDQSLWDEFRMAVSHNRPDDPRLTIEKFNKLPIRQPGHTHVIGYDYIIFIPVFIDNVNSPYIDRANKLGIDVDTEYKKMMDKICKAYQARWHL